MSDRSWRADAACLGMDPNFFFNSANLKEIRRRCAGCPVFEQCFEWCTGAVTVEEAPHGIIAGYTEHQRWAIAGGNHVPDWRERTGRNVTTPLKEVRSAPGKGLQQLLERAASRPQCPQCDTGIDVHRYRRNSAGQQVWVHLPCKTKIVEAA